MKYTFLPAEADNAVNHVGSYRRRLPVSIERMYENTLDWAHLPHLHKRSFAEIRCLDAGAWGWRAQVGNVGASNPSKSLIELKLDRQARRWITRNLEGPNKGAEIWTHVFVEGENVLDIVVDFYVPDVPPEAKEKVGLAYAKAYEQLYDEDVAMMVERQQQIDRRVEGFDRSETLALGPAHELILPVLVTLSRRDFVVIQIDDEWLAYSAQCPHQMGPLIDSPVVQEEVRCPWHGYTFNVRTGECTSGAVCQLTESPDVTVDDGGALILRWADA